MAEHTLPQPERGEDQPDLAARNHADADEQLVAGPAEHARRGHELAEHRDKEQHRGDPEHLAVGEGFEVDVDTDLEEEHGDQQVPDGSQLAAYAVGGVRARQREAGHERTDDRRQVGRVRKLGASASVKPSASATNVPAERLWRRIPANSGGAIRRPTAVAITTNPIATSRDLGDADGRHAAFGDDARDDSEDDEADHVVGDRGAEHSARFDRCERTEVAEHPRSDADARGRQCRADEQRFFAVEAEADAGAEAGRHRHDDADDCDEEGRAPDGTQIPQVHLEADLEQQQDHAELGEDVQDLVGLDNPEQRRPDEHAGDDLGDDRREADAIRDLGSDLRRDDHDQDVEQYRVDVHWRPLP